MPLRPEPAAAPGRSATPRRWAVIAGGGTGGHVMPALAVGEALVASGHDPATIHFVGARRGIEATLVPQAGFGVTLLPGRGVARKLTLANIGAVVGLTAAVLQAFAVLVRHRPAVVVSVGGFASVPCAVAAVVLRIPLVLVGLDAVPGAALRLVARFAAASAVAFEGTPLPRATVTGSPVRPEVAAVERTAEARRAARDAFGLPADRAVVGVMTGSLGARRVNDAVAGLARRWRARGDVAVRHVTGRRDFEDVTAAAPDPSPGGLVYQVVAFEDRMDLLYAAADVMVCRGGASTAAELTTVGVPAVIVPLPGSPGDHQTANARALEQAGAAVMLADGDVDIDRLAEILDPLVGDPARLEAMSAASARLGHPDAAARIAAIVERHAAA